MNKLNNPSICCVNCGKGYKSKVGLDKHLILCELVKKIKSGKKIEDEEEIEVPSPKMMYKMILELGLKYNRLEEKTTEMNKWVVKKKKKVDVVVWLNDNLKPEYDFDEITERISITDTDIEIMLENSLYDTLYAILFRVLDVDAPIFAFNQKPGILYIFENEFWFEIPVEKLTRLLNICQKKVSKAMLDWKKKHKDEFNSSDSFATRYDKAVVRLMSVEFRNSAHFNKAKSMIYGKLKTDAKTVVEYEFE
jgi:hypothetical protein